MKTHAQAAMLLVAVSSASAAAGQTRFVPHPLPHPVVEPAPAIPTSEGAPWLRATFGMERVISLLRSTSDEDVVRGIARLAALETPESLTLLVRATGPAGTSGDGVAGCARRDPRALLAAVRALAHRTDHEPARRALLEVLDAGPQQIDTAAAGPNAAERDDTAARTGRVELARQQAALALAAMASTAVDEKLLDVVRREGPGEAAAVAALTAYPPESPVVLGGVALTTRSTIGLASAVSDLRTMDALLGVLKASDPAVRAAALTALGETGDARVVEAARTAAHDPAAKVRVAAAGALVHLGVADAGPAVEALVADAATALDGLRLASEVQGDGVTRAAAARAAASSDAGVRAAALQALGRQTSPAAVAALVELAHNPTLRGDAMGSLARSPSGAALPALEDMASRAGDARMAARAYFVRRLVRGARSEVLDALLARLSASTSATDRVVGIEAAVALGEKAVGDALRDPDARVRAAAAMGAAARLDAPASDALIAQLRVEPDAVTRTVLALGLLRGDGRDGVPGSFLLERLQTGAPDAPLAALALARRSRGTVPAYVASLLASRDPVMRAHVARGLGECDAPDASGLLGAAYQDEPEAIVRDAIIRALARRPPPIGPGAEGALTLAATLDPDPRIRAVAERALRGTPMEPCARTPEVAWLSLVPAEGAALPVRATASLVDDSGVALPIAFDDDGLALEPGVAPGPYRLRLAPRVPPYSPSPP